MKTEQLLQQIGDEFRDLKERLDEEQAYVTKLEDVIKAMHAVIMASEDTLVEDREWADATMTKILWEGKHADA